ncbi:pyridoxal phosphate-dependent aminotransferase [Nitratireductor sp. ZSWI3]|uniref:pyridoxal phosphate-dependent aminotransferase n=1 Tax=Nitratireductor sp. ZSWI3 TaxID=2966359 RepID=UPI00214F89DF|nr:aminotransferase class I/II-fold pyridoxal phosphate-dependent enzyme [Nitratireductor sp. ZSWI3]MCR4267728.1 aminotransferase class I/II-fold pyridoxal phosphate-dependent enzyme [Nitratireductor sp. ZSWI3]
MPLPSARISGIVPSGKNGWEVHFAALARKQAGEDIIMLSVGDHDFDTPEGTVEACVEAVRGGFHHYTQLPGLPRLREGLARLSSECTGVSTTADEILVTIGGQGALYAAFQAVLDPGAHAVIVSPYYATYPGTVRAAGGRFTEIETHAENGFEPKLDEIEAALEADTRAILINSPNNPTGAVYSRATIERIAEICRERDLWLLSDEVYWTIRAEAEHISPRALAGMKERTLVINSLSKSHGMTGWRIGWLTGPADMIAVMTNLNLVATYGLPDFISRAAIAAVENGYGVAEIAERYGKRRSAFLDAIRGMNGVTVRGSQGGMYVMLDIRAVEADSEKFAWDLLAAENVAVMPGASFGAAANGHIRISMCQDEALLGEAARRLRRFVGERLGAGLTGSAAG